MDPPPDAARFATLLPSLTPHRRTLLAALGLLLTSSAITLAIPWIAGQLAASLLGAAQAWASPRVLLALWLLLMLLHSLLAFSTRYVTGSAGEHITAELRRRIYQHLQSLPLAYFEQRRAGDSLTLLSTDAVIISGFVTDTLVQLLPALLTFTGAFVLMAWLEPSIALLAVLFVPAFFVGMKLLGRRLRPLSRAWVDANSALVALVQENLSLMPAIKAFTREQPEQYRFDRANRALYDLSRAQLRIEALLAPAVGLLGASGLSVLLWMGIGAIERGSLTAGELVSLLLYATLLINPLRTLADVYGRIQRTRGSAGRVIDFLAERSEPPDAGRVVLGNVAGHIRFEAVTFAYPGRPPVLTDFDLEIAAGETVALVGRNGSGKSTLAHLLMRFADPTSGRILLDGRDLREVTLASLRSRVGLVAQHVLLLNGTVADNIAFGAPDAAPESVEAAARAAHAHEFVEALPEGYATQIGDQGVRLSGGQRQRLALARALLRDPAILVLDEATAMFDPAGETAFLEECRDLLRQRTVIVITHRPASLAVADRVVRMDHA